jgi:hypothetical protein
MGKLHSVVQSSYSRVTCWTPAARWQKLWAENGSGDRSLAHGTRPGSCYSDNGADRRGPTWFNIFPDFPKPFQTCESKQIPSSTPKIPKFFIMLDWSVMHNFLNCANFKFPIKIMLKIMEQIQQLNLL